MVKYTKHKIDHFNHGRVYNLGTSVVLTVVHDHHPLYIYNIFHHSKQKLLSVKL